MRIDTYLCENGFFESREKAKKALSSGRVRYCGRIVSKPSLEVTDEGGVEVIPSAFCEYVGRGGIKLEKALDFFSVSPAGMRVIDIGASTGGFTDCLLRRNAEKVYAVDIGHDQLHSSLRNDRRVVNIEGVNARFLTEDIVDNEKCDLAVSDLSFISLTLVIPAVRNVLKSGGLYITLIKPQFEAGRENISKNGIVKSEKARAFSVSKVVACCESNGFIHKGTTESPIKGGSGNIEYLALFELQ